METKVKYVNHITNRVNLGYSDFCSRGHREQRQQGPDLFISTTIDKIRKDAMYIIQIIGIREKVNRAISLK